MGGFSYEREDYGTSSSSGWSSYGYSGSSEKSSYSSYAESKMSARHLEECMRPNHRITSKSKHPIVVALDVTGSNRQLAKIIYDKSPMMYGQIEQKKYLDDFDICFMAVGDAIFDDYPLQVGEFAKGIEIDTYLEKLVLEGGGGTNSGESYELAAFYLEHFMDMQEGAEPFIFFIGDEKTLYDVSITDAANAGIPTRDLKNVPLESQEVWDMLKDMCNGNVYCILGKYQNRCFRDDITEHWENLLGKDHVIKIEDGKAIVDIILGVIAMVSNSRDMDSYKVDMLERGQTEKRICDVSKSLKNLSTSLAVYNQNADITLTKATKKSEAKGKRL